MYNIWHLKDGELSRRDIPRKGEADSIQGESYKYSNKTIKHNSGFNVQSQFIFPYELK
jgi:hypothetical protein